MDQLILSDLYLQTIKDIIKHYYPDATVWAYGSRVTGNCHEGSDLDLVLLEPDDAQNGHARFSAMKAAFSDSNIPILIDIRLWRDLPSAFQTEIKRHYVQLLPEVLT
ncbi:MAG: nucleotidyltransferase domain-containing protein [Gammaproteobacteria bacterium]